MEKRTKFILIGLGVVAAGTGGYFIYHHLQKKNDENDIQAFQNSVTSGDIALPAAAAPTRPASVPSGYKPKPANSTFPLTKGSKGTLVKDIQTAMVKQYGGAIFPKYGADGYWGAELQNALIAKKLPLVIDATAYGTIIGGKAKSPAPVKKPATAVEVNSSTISKLLHTAIAKDDIFGALDALKKIKNTTKYKTVNTEFKKTYVARAGVRKTIVTALNDQFYSAESKKKINAEFYRIGLKYNGTVWSLSGLNGTSRLVTISPTKIWDNWGTTIQVPKSTILGEYLNAGNGATEFQALDGRIFLVNTNHIRYEQ